MKPIKLSPFVDLISNKKKNRIHILSKKYHIYLHIYIFSSSNAFLSSPYQSLGEPNPSTTPIHTRSSVVLLYQTPLSNVKHRCFVTLKAQRTSIHSSFIGVREHVVARGALFNHSRLTVVGTRLSSSLDPPLSPKTPLINRFGRESEDHQSVPNPKSTGLDDARRGSLEIDRNAP